MLKINFHAHFDTFLALIILFLQVCIYTWVSFFSSEFWQYCHKFSLIFLNLCSSITVHFCEQSELQFCLWHAYFICKLRAKVLIISCLQLIHHSSYIRLLQNVISEFNHYFIKCTYLRAVCIIFFIIWWLWIVYWSDAPWWENMIWDWS